MSIQHIAIMNQFYISLFLSAIHFLIFGFRLFANKLQEDTIIGKIFLALLLRDSLSFHLYIKLSIQQFQISFLLYSVYLLRIYLLCCCYNFFIERHKGRNIKRKVFVVHFCTRFSLFRFISFLRWKIYSANSFMMTMMLHTEPKLNEFY